RACTPADTPAVRTSTDGNYFVRLDKSPAPPVTPRSEWERSRPPQRRKRRRRRPHVRLLYVLGLLLGAWFLWAASQPGGVSGTINGWIDHVRGDVAKISADPDMHKAAAYLNGQFAANHQYPRITDDQRATDIGIGVEVQWCGPQAVVLQGSVGGGTASRLLLNGADVGTVSGKVDCPADLANPTPWKLKN
ncbi:MAG TPA: hypothetical protein VFR41_16230, partial [Acidimicrobiia bacterium]|nr:hypothetical protein [Acidimicrobiia bacterium]